MACSSNSSSRISNSLSRITSLGKQYPDFNYKGPIKVCDYGLVAPKWASWMNLNPGLQFWKCKIAHYCPNGEQIEGCKFYEWKDNYIRGRAKDIINSLKENERSLNLEIQGLRVENAGLLKNSSPVLVNHSTCERACSTWNISATEQVTSSSVDN